MDEAIVVGGGVIGLTTAVLLAERGTRVRVWSRDAEADTTSAVAGGLLWPYRIEPRERATAWAVRSFGAFAQLAERPGTTGVRFLRGTMADGWAPPEWTTLVGSPPRSMVVDMSTYLPYLRGRLAAAGGRWERREAASLAQAAAQAPVVFHCTGLGARELAADPSVRPIRGQLVVVENPGIDEWYVAADTGAESTYLLPQPYGLLLGGTAQDGAWDTAPDPALARAVVRRCAALHPEVARARVLAHRVGLRPYRPSVRLEAERLPAAVPGGRGALCVHDYGHGGAGVTVSWGCAADSLRLLDAAV